MAMNKFMHSKNIYQTPPEFSKLAQEFPEFGEIAKTNAKGKVYIDFKNEDALKALTKCLLKRDFNLTVNLPPKQLVPTLSLRLNYILWIEDIVETFKLKDVIGLDIGCGASCIYPLLATRRNSDWHMYAIELNEDSIEIARANVTTNELQDRIEIFANASKADPLDSLTQNNDKWQRFDFTMCNPPFFHDELESESDESKEADDDGEKSHGDKQKPPNNAKTGIGCELMTAGGEVEFVKKIIQQSKQFHKRISIFTTMLGHKASLNPILQELKVHGITNFCTSEFCQGWTKRWGIAWTFRNDLPLRLVPTLGQTQPKPPQRFLPSDVDDPEIAAKKLRQILSELTETEIINQEKFETGERFQFIALSSSWKNQRRKRRQLAREQQQKQQEQQQQTDKNQQANQDDEKEKSNSGTDNIVEKKRRLDETHEAGHIAELVKSSESPPVLHIEFNIQSKTVSDLKAIVVIEIAYLNGTLGLNGVYEILQFIQNKWSQ